ncbi:MAG TPA: NAD-dependent epimerase/dehydratase family protein [Baekduia sp.]|uniref:NAD-dependent epimerase/dehydratase family protein n=1 Tax=Baekduia sp. TaxID=2600305 RepID=UPI002C4518BF|nr:NAD-dependent epimerase/dehydratase family protein [Baekduia sp.]HMJ32803.1 NAD-dependent epimerase/dehydratase family protein [Baekduia sp.]
MTRLLVLGGTSFVGRALVEDGVRRGWDVTTFNRGRHAWAHPSAEHLHGDRLEVADLAPLAAREWDVVADTWAGAPRAARDSANALADRAQRYLYVSSGSVYAPPPPIDGDEDAPTVDASPDAESTDYAADKRGAELAVEQAFGDRALLARAGLILGPHEDVGRLPAWLLRLDRGGEVLAPGPPDRPLQLIDARDLAAWMLDSATAERSGPFNVISRSGFATMGSLLETCRAVTRSNAQITYVDAAFVAEQGIEPWSELPIWLPADHEFAGMLATGVQRAHAAGLRNRPLADTVQDTWDWLLSVDKVPTQRPDLPPHGLHPDKERAALASWHARG